MYVLVMQVSEAIFLLDWNYGNQQTPRHLEKLLAKPLKCDIFVAVEISYKHDALSVSLACIRTE